MDSSLCPFHFQGPRASIHNVYQTVTFRNIFPSFHSCPSIFNPWSGPRIQHDANCSQAKHGNQTQIFARFNLYTVIWILGLSPFLAALVPLNYFKQVTWGLIQQQRILVWHIASLTSSAPPAPCPQAIPAFLGRQGAWTEHRAGGVSNPRLVDGPPGTILTIMVESRL